VGKVGASCAKALWLEDSLLISEDLQQGHEGRVQRVNVKEVEMWPRGRLS
jgi:hypothetical protein